MPLSLRRGRVSAIAERHAGLVRLEVDDRPCIAYPRLTGPVALGDDVIVNTQAADLALGSGGFDVLVANLTRGLGLPPADGAHVMKLPYTALQHAAVHAEEGGARVEELAGMPVVACTLHSQVVPVCAALGAGPRIAYLQVEGGALPVSLSDAVRSLRTRGLIETTVAVGPCIDGDVACVSAASGLLWAAGAGCDVAVCAVGPGIVGTGSRLGHGALGLVASLAAASALGGSPIVAPRVSTVEERSRHAGLSHHTLAVLELSPPGVKLPWPAGSPVEEPPGAELVDVTGWQEACAGLPLSTMGRGPAEDPWFFASAFAAGRLARGLIEPLGFTSHESRHRP